MTMALIAAIRYFHEVILLWFEYQWFIGFPIAAGQLDMTHVTFPVTTATSPLSARIMRPGVGASNPT